MCQTAVRNRIMRIEGIAKAVMRFEPYKNAAANKPKGNAKLSRLRGEGLNGIKISISKSEIMRHAVKKEIKTKNIGINTIHPRTGDW
jgi:hypothetical protein